MDGAAIAPNELFAPVPSLGDEIGTFEHGDVFLDRGEAHVVPHGELRHRCVLAHRSSQDVAARSIGEGLEDPVDFVVVQLSYNHLVAR